MKPLLCLLLCSIPVWVSAQQFTWDARPDRTWPDSIHHPFILGVASSEPEADRVYIWTYVEPDSFSQPNKTVFWELAEDSTFSPLLQSGTASADSNRSWTLEVAVDGLSPDTYYWYRFKDAAGNTSTPGRTRTLPTEGEEIKLAVGSCSNMIAYYNTYARIAEIEDLNGIIHLGDWAYDNFNEDRADRLPEPNVTIRCAESDRRKRDYLHLLDPDLRAVRAKHPPFLLWDNHDIQRGDPESVKDGCRRVFRQFNGQPVIDTADIARQYRKVSMGSLVDLFILDIQWLQDRRDSINGYESYLGAEQHTWFLDELAASTARWKLVGQQKLFGEFSIATLSGLIPGGIDATEKSWDGYAEERTDFLEFIRDNEIDNVMILSGDAHFAITSDLPLDPFNPLEYNGSTGDGSIAVEYLPSGFSSPNIDERGVAYSLGSLLTTISLGANPHQVFAEFMDNGYGILSIDRDSVVADLWLLDAHSPNTSQSLADRQILYNRANHWKRAGDTYVNRPEPLKRPSLLVYPNPASELINLDWKGRAHHASGPLEVSIFDLTGHLIENFSFTSIPPNVQLSTQSLPKGSFLIRVRSTQGEMWNKFLRL